MVDLKSAVLLQNLRGLSQPQGVLFVPSTDELYVANGGDGAIHVYGGADRSPTATIALGEDADNLRLDPVRRHVVAGHGDGGLALIDASTHRVVANIPLHGHPEGFQMSLDGRLAGVNVPDRREIDVIDLVTPQRTASWPTADLKNNFPMALEATGAGLWTALRSPPRLVRFDTT